MPAPQPVSVNGVVIARDAIAREVQNHPADKPILSWQSAARALAVRELLLQEARRLGLTPKPKSDEDSRRETDDEALIRALVEREITTPAPDADACRRYYEQNRKRFRSPAIYEASHILFAAHHNDTEGFARARGEAMAALAAIKREPARFDDFAREHSACPSAAQGGNLGQLTVEQVTPEFGEALEEMTPGETCAAPVATRYGFHVIRLDRKHEGRTLPYEAVADRIAGYLGESVRRRAAAQYVARLVSAAQITGLDIEGAEAHRVN